SAGGLPPRALGAGESMRIFTGAPLPQGADAVVPQEDVAASGDRVTVRGRIAPGAYVRPAGEDVRAGDIVVKPGGVIGAAEVGLLATLGYPQVRVYRRPRVAILSTGNQLADLGSQPGPAQIPNTNTYSLMAQVIEAGGEPVNVGVAPDQLEAITERVRWGLEASDMLVTSAGVSVGELDLVREALERGGARLHLWQGSMRPGKPVTFGTRGEQPLFGLPGNPVSAMGTFELFVRPALPRTAGRRGAGRPPGARGAGARADRNPRLAPRLPARHPHGRRRRLRRASDRRAGLSDPALDGARRRACDRRARHHHRRRRAGRRHRAPFARASIALSFLTSFSAACYGRKWMSRGFCVLAALAILASGCASRRESDVERLRSELSELRVAQQVTSRDLANATSQLQALDVKMLADEVARLNRRADAADAALADARVKLDMLATPPAVAGAPPVSSPLPAPLRPAPPGVAPRPAPPPPAAAVMTPAPSNRAAITPPPAPLPPQAAVAPALVPAAPLTPPPAAAVDKPRLPPSPTVAPARPAPKNPEQ